MLKRTRFLSTLTLVFILTIVLANCAPFSSGKITKTPSITEGVFVECKFIFYFWLAVWRSASGFQAAAAFSSAQRCRWSLLFVVVFLL